MKNHSVFKRLLALALAVMLLCTVTVPAFAEDEEPVAPCEHSYAEEVTPATCTVNGEKKLTCSLCGDVQSEVLYASHDYAGELTTAATCEAEGVMTYTCSVCGDVQTDVVAKLSHSYVDHVCSACGAAEPLMKSGGSPVICDGTRTCTASSHDSLCLSLCTCTARCASPSDNPGCPICGVDNEAWYASYCQACSCTRLCSDSYVENSCNLCRADHSHCEGKCTWTEGCTAAKHASGCPELECICTDKCQSTGKSDCPTCSASSDLPNDCRGKKAPVYTVDASGRNIPMAGHNMQVVVVYDTDETEQEALQNGYGDWICEFYLSFSGVEGDTIDLDGCGVAGQIYGVQRAVMIDENYEIPSDMVIPMVAALAEAEGWSGFRIPWSMVCAFAEGEYPFTCGITISDELLSNPNFKVVLEFVISSPYDSQRIVDETLIFGVNDLMNMNAVAAVMNSSGTTYHETLAAANAAAQAGDTILLLADQTLDAAPVQLASGVTLDLNGKKLVGNVLGTVSMNGGTFSAIDADGEFKMIAPSDSTFRFNSSDAVFVNAASGVTLTSGSVSLGFSWRTLPGQSVITESGTSFTIPADMSFCVRGQAEVKGTLTVEDGGKVILGEEDTKSSSLGATLKTMASVADKVESGIEGYEVVETEENGVYTYKLEQVMCVELRRDDEVVGEYPSIAEAAAVAEEGDIIALIEDCELSEDVEIPEGVNFDLNGKTLTTAEEDNFKAEGFCAKEDGDKYVIGEHAFAKLDDEYHQCPNCGGKEKHTGGTATCFTRAVCDVCEEEYGDEPSHTLQYSVDPDNKNVIIQTCTDPNCPGSTAQTGKTRAAAGAHKATATLQLKESPVYYTGEALTPAEVVYSDDWVGAKPQVISYTNNIGPGKATAKTTIEGATAELEFDISMRDYKIEPAQRYTAKSGKSMSFITDGPASKDKLESVLITRNIGGKQTAVDLKYVTLSTATNGDTVLTIDKAVMNTLERGKYLLEVEWSDGAASCSFRIISTPITGDDSNMLLWGGAALLTLCGMLTVGIVLKKRSRKA